MQVSDDTGLAPEAGLPRSGKGGGPAFWLMGLFVVAYIAGTLGRAAEKALTNDELLTFYLASLNRGSDLWSALLAGSDGNPPLGYLLTHLSMAIFGRGAVAIRMPAIMGFFVFSLCLYLFVARRTNRQLGLLAAVIPSVTLAYNVAFEGRMYGMMLCCAGIMLVCWQATVGNCRNRWAAFGFGAIYAVAVSLHYYSILLVGPFVLGELVRALRTRRSNPWLWVCAVAGGSLILAWQPLMATQKRMAGTFWSPPTPYSVPSFYEHLISPAIEPGVLVLLTLCGYFVARQIFFTRTEKKNVGTGKPVFLLEEVAVAVGFFLYPFGIVAIAYLSTNAFHDRYPMPAVAGLAILIAFGMSALGGDLSRRKVLLVLAPTLVWFFLIQVSAAKALVQPSSNGFSNLELPQSDLPVAVSDDHLFLRFSFYSKPELSARLNYIADPQSAAKMTGSDTADRILPVIARWAHLSVGTYPSFLAAHERFLVYGSYGWLIRRLLDEGADVKVVGSYESGARLGDGRETSLLFLVDTRHHKDAP